MVWRFFSCPEVSSLAFTSVLSQWNFLNILCLFLRGTELTHEMILGRANGEMSKMRQGWKKNKTREKVSMGKEARCPEIFLEISWCVTESPGGTTTVLCYCFPLLLVERHLCVSHTHLFHTITYSYEERPWVLVKTFWRKENEVGNCLLYLYLNSGGWKSYGTKHLPHLLHLW